MKKLLFGLVVIALALTALFYSQLRATIDFYTYQSDHADTFKKATIVWQEIPFTSATRSGVASDSLIFKELSVPVPYGATKSIGQDAAFATGYTELITVTTSSAVANFFRMYNFSDSERQTACTLLSHSSGRGACTTNYDFYRAFLELNKTDVHVFTPINDKSMYNRLVTLRAEAIPSTTVAGFETSSLRGFLFTLDTKNFQAEIFTPNDQQYHFEFQGLTEADVAFVLSNATITK